MKSATFDDLAQELIDAWIARSEVCQPSTLYRGMMERLPANMILAIITFTVGEPSEFNVDVVRDYVVPTSYDDVAESLKTRLPMLPGGSVHPSIAKAISGRRPSLVAETVRHSKVLTNFEMLALPRPTAKLGEDWCLVFGVIHYLLQPVSLRKDLDDIDLAILQLLREGLQLRQIGHRVELSPRTIEHRIERLKDLVDAKTLHDLVARTL